VRPQPRAYTHTKTPTEAKRGHHLNGYPRHREETERTPIGDVAQETFVEEQRDHLLLLGEHEHAVLGHTAVHQLVHVRRIEEQLQEAE
jgi:hypothetical protein